MNSYYTFVFFAFILLFSSSSLAYRMFTNADDQDQENIFVSRRMILVPSEVVYPGSNYILPSSYQIPDERVRRGWGSGRRRRSNTDN